MNLHYKQNERVIIDAYLKTDGILRLVAYLVFIYHVDQQS